MDKNSVFMTAFWASLAAPSAFVVSAQTPIYRPLVSSLTVGDSFLFVGALLDKALVEDNERRDASGGEQLSFDFARA